MVSKVVSASGNTRSESVFPWLFQLLQSVLILHLQGQSSWVKSDANDPLTLFCLPFLLLRVS